VIEKLAGDILSENHCTVSSKDAYPNPKVKIKGAFAISIQKNS